MKTRKMTIVKENGSSDDRDFMDIYYHVVAYYEAKVELFEKMAGSELIKQRIREHLQGLAVAGLIVDYTAAYYTNPYPQIPNAVYAGITVLSDFLKDYLAKLSLVTVFDEDAVLGFMPPVTVLLASLQLVDAFYPELNHILDEERGWYESLITPDHRQTALETMQMVQAGDSYGMTLLLQAMLKVVHGVMGEVRTVGQYGIDVLRPALQQWASYFTPEDFQHLGDDRASFLESVGKPIENAFELASMTSAVMRNTGLPFDAAQRLVAYSFLHDTSLASYVDDQWTSQMAQQHPDVFNRETMNTLLNEMDKRISANPLLQAMKKQLNDLTQESLAAKIERLRQQEEREIRKGYDDALQLGGTIAQFGQLVNSKALVQAGRVFQESIHIIQGLQALEKFSQLEIFKTLGNTLSNLNLGPISMIASAVMSIISLFHSTGPSKEDIIIKQLNQLQKGVQQILQNQAMIVDAINQSYVNLLNAIQAGVEQLVALMQSEFREVEKEFYVLSHQLNYYTQQILNELTRLEFSIDQGRLAPLRSAIKAAEDFNQHYPDTQHPAYGQEVRQEVRYTLNTLEEWGSETVCDPSFTGNVESDYGKAIRDPDAIYRHFPRREMIMSDVVAQSGFLLGIFSSLISSNSTEIQACNMNLWLHILSVYNKLLPHTITFPYDPDGRLIQKMLKPANQTKKMVALFQRQAFLLATRIQDAISSDVDQVSSNCENNLQKIQTDLMQRYQDVLFKQRELLAAFIAGICTNNVPYLQIPGIQRDNTPFCNALKAAAQSHADVYEGRLNAPIWDLKKPFLALMSGGVIDIKDHPIQLPSRMPNLPGNVLENVFKYKLLGSALLTTYPASEVHGLLIPALSEIEIPVSLTLGELLQNGNMAASFAYSPTVWDHGTLTCVVTLHFNPVNGTQFPVAEVVWNGSIDDDARDYFRRLGYVDAVTMLNNVPLFPWSDACSSPLTGCVKWSNTTRYLIDPFDPSIQAVTARNQLAIAGRIASLQMANAFGPEGTFSFLYEALESKWRLYKAFALAVGIAPNSIQAMNEFDIMKMLAEEITAIRDYDVVSGTEVTSLEPRILARFEPFFADVMNQTLALGHSSQAISMVSNSSLTDFIHQIDQSSKLILAMKRLHQEAGVLEEQRKRHPSAIGRQGDAYVATPSPRSAAQGEAAHQGPWFTWPGFLLGSAAGVVLPVVALMSYGCVLERRGRLPNEGYYELGRMGRVLAYLLNLPGARSASITASTYRPSDPIPSISALTRADAWQDEETPYDVGWDNDTESHARTGMPIFTYRAYREGVEIGSAQFYRHPLLCRSLDGTRHNVMHLSGVFQDYEDQIDPQHIDEICASLPPTRLEHFTEGAYSGVQHGVIRGSSRLVEEAMQQQGYSQRTAEGVKTACYYFALFAMNTTQYYAEDATENESERLQYAAQQAAIETARVAMASCAIHMACNTLSWAADKARASGWQRTAGVVDNVSRYAGLSIYAYNGHRRGVAHLAGSVVGGYAAENAVVAVGNTALSAFAR